MYPFLATTTLYWIATNTFTTFTLLSISDEKMWAIYYTVTVNIPALHHKLKTTYLYPN